MSMYGFLIFCYFDNPMSLMPWPYQRSLKTQLATVTDSIDLLKAEIEREEALLAKETRQFQDLEKNAKATETERKRQMKNVSPRVLASAAY